MLLGDEGTSVKLTFRKDNQLSNFQSQEASGGNVMSLCTAGGVLQGEFQDYDVELKRMTFSGNDQLGLSPSTPDSRAGQCQTQTPKPPNPKPQTPDIKHDASRPKTETKTRSESGSGHPNLKHRALNASFDSKL
jgi:hypothetical protein